MEEEAFSAAVVRPLLIAARSEASVAVINLQTFLAVNEATIWSIQLSWYQKAVLWVLRQGVVPRHVAIVPDGNRRYARSKDMEPSKAYGMLIQNLVLFCHWVAHLGVKNMSSFVLSSRNFTRASSDLDAVLEKLFVFFATALNSIKLTWAVCAAYTSRQSTNHMVFEFAKAVRQGTILPGDITPELVDEYLALNESPEVQLWFRCSGEVRFSEFLVLQNSYAYIHRDAVFWPAIQLWNFVCAVLMFQLHWPKITAVKESHYKLKALDTMKMEYGALARQREFLKCTEVARMKFMQEYTSRA